MGDVIQAVEGGHLHWCSGCDDVHLIPSRWEFNGSLSAPTFSPSVLHQWTFGGQKEPRCCHYFIRGGVIEYCGDCWHRLNGQTEPLVPAADWC